MTGKIRSMYSKLPVQAKASLWFFVCAFLQGGLQIISTPIFTRLLSTAEYGVFNVFTSWQSILTVLVTLNLSAGVYMRGMVMFGEEKGAYASSLQGLTLSLVSVWTVLFLVFHRQWSSLTSISTVQMLLMFALLWSNAAFTFWSTEQRVELNYKKLIPATLVISIGQLALSIVLVSLLNDKVTGRILGMAIVSCAVGIVLFSSQMTRGRVFCSGKFWKHAVLFNIPLIPHYLSMSVLFGADRIMIERIVSSDAAGLYSLAYAIANAMLLLNTAMMQAIEPWLYKKINSGIVRDIGKIAYPAFTFFAVVGVLLIAVAPELLAIFAPPEYRQAVYAIPPVAMSTFFLFSYTFFAAFEFYYKKTRMIAVATTSGAILNIILNGLFIPRFGYLAAAYTTLICYMVYAGAHFFFMRRLCKKNLNGQEPYSLKQYLSIVLAFLIVGFLFLAAYENAGIRYAMIGAFLIVIVLLRKKCMEAVKAIVSVRDESRKESEI